MFQKHFQKACDSIVGQALYVVATPVGNLADITLRALAVLRRADIICAEDTRVTAQLLSAYGIQGRLVSVREHNERQMADKIIGYLSDGMMAALSVAGVAESDFYFNGFVPPKSGERRKLFAKWVRAAFPIVMFETPHRIGATLADMVELFPERRLMLAREITKTFETFLSGTVEEIQTALSADSNQSRGEMVLILYPAQNENTGGLPESVQNVMKILAAELPTKQAAELAAKITGEGKKALYDLALSWKNK